MRVALQDAAVHEGAGVALVGVADDELSLGRLLGDGGPLQPGRVAGAAAAAQAAPRDLRDDLGRAHLTQDVVQGLVPSGLDVRLDPVRLDQPAVLQDDGHLAGEERVFGVAALRGSLGAAVQCAARSMRPPRA